LRAEKLVTIGTTITRRPGSDGSRRPRRTAKRSTTTAPQRPTSSVSNPSLSPSSIEHQSRVSKWTAGSYREGV